MQARWWSLGVQGLNVATALERFRGEVLGEDGPGDLTLHIAAEHLLQQFQDGPCSIGCHGRIDDKGEGSIVLTINRSVPVT